MEYITRQWILQTFFSLDLSFVKIHYDRVKCQIQCMYSLEIQALTFVLLDYNKGFVNENINMKFYNKLLMKLGFDEVTI